VFKVVMNTRASTVELGLNDMKVVLCRYKQVSL